MKKARSSDLKKIGNENSYTKEFFDELYTKITVEDRTVKAVLERTIILAAQAYMTHYGEYLRQLVAHEVEKELKKVVNHIDKAAGSFVKVVASGSYGEDIVNNLYDVIVEKYPSMRGTLTEIRRSSPYAVVTSPLKALDFLASIGDAIDLTVKNSSSPKRTPRSIALYHWIMILSAKLEPIIGHKLEQSHYYKEGKKGEYISKKEMSDAELLLFIISPLDPNATISQIETAIKDTRKERHNAPWDNYFP